MANSKIEFKIGNIEFIGEGEQKWLSEQLDKILENIPNLMAYEVTEIDKTNTKDVANIQPQIIKENKITETLSTFLRNRKATENQRRKFLGTAVYLQNKGNESLTSKDVTDALQKAKQTKLSNAAHQLSQNIKQGLCEKHGKTFYVTPEGLSKIMG